MKALSASIIVLAGAIVLSIGATIQHNDTQLFICSVGLFLGVVGLAVWGRTLRSE